MFGSRWESIGEPSQSDSLLCRLSPKMVFIVWAPLVITGLSWCRWTASVTLEPAYLTGSAIVSMGYALVTHDGDERVT